MADGHWTRRDPHRPIDVSRRLRAGAWKGMVAGAGGVVAMTLAEKLEQRITGRPDSYMPAHTLERLLRLPQRADSQRWLMNIGMHGGQAVLLGVWRGLMAEGGLRGPRASAAFTVIRLFWDQTLENVTGQGAPPWSWPRHEMIIDTMHKAVYAFVAQGRLRVRDRPHRRCAGQRRARMA